MKLFFEDGESYIDTKQGLDLSITIGSNYPKVKAWYLDDPIIEPVKAEGFVGAVAQGAAVNFRNIFFNPHAHGTHTEGLGHITNEVFSVNEISHPLFYKSKVVSIVPTKVEVDGEIDFVITTKQIEELELGKEELEAIIIRTLPNGEKKLSIDYSNSNPCYLEAAGATIIRDAGIHHLLIDLPSVDKEKDDGVLAFHHTFWAVPESPDKLRTITEFIYVQDRIEDGLYMLNLQVAPIENDASPSRPVLYKIFKA